MSSFVTNNVRDIHLMFSGCISLEYLDITNFELDSRKLGYYYDMFEDDVNLHLIIRRNLYYIIYDENPFLRRINVTIVD